MFKNLNKNTLYQFLLILLFISLPAGSYLLPVDLGYFHLFLFRMVLLLFLIVLIFTGDVKLYSGRMSKMLFFILLFWWGYGILSLSWAMDQDEALKELGNIASGILLLIIFSTLYHKISQFLNTTLLGWITGFAIIGIIAIYEITTSSHLEGNYIDKLRTHEYLHPANQIPVATFDNPNNLATYLCLSLPLFYAFYKAGQKGFTLLCIFLAIALIYITKSRLALIAVIFQLGFFILSVQGYWFKRKLFRFRYHILTITILTVATIYAIFSINDTHNVIAEHDLLRQEEQRMEQQDSTITLPMPVIPQDTIFTTLEARTNLIKNGIQFIRESYGMGIGAGNYSVYLEQGRGNYEVYSLRNPHNYPIEIISQYGIIVFILLLAWGIYLLVFFLRGINKYRNYRLNIFKLFGMTMLIGYAIVSNAPSSFINSPVNWLALVTIAIAADIVDNKKIPDELKSG